MVKRYEFIETYGMVVRAESDDGDYVLASDFDQMRRRLVVKLLRERARSLDLDRFGRASGWYLDTADAIERGEPLEYFRKLGED